MYTLDLQRSKSDEWSEEEDLKYQFVIRQISKEAVMYEEMKSRAASLDLSGSSKTGENVSSRMTNTR